MLGKTQNTKLCDALRRDVPLFLTPEEFLGMEANDPAKLRRFIKRALEHVRETGGLRPSDLQLPIFTVPPTCTP